jgi:hypothetical protein
VNDVSGGIRDFTEGNRRALLNGVLYDCLDNNFTSQSEINHFAEEVTELVPETASDFAMFNEFFTSIRGTINDAIQIVGQVFNDVDLADMALRAQLRTAKSEAQILLTALQGLNQMIDGGTGLRRPVMDFRIMAEGVIFQIEVDRVMNAMFPYVLGERRVCWDTLQEVMARPYSDISEAEFAVLAMLFASFDSLADQERFLNYLIDQIETSSLTETFVNGEIKGFDSFSLTDGIPLFLFCQEKVGGIQRHIDGAIMLVWQTQIELGEGPDYRSLGRLRRKMMERSALLDTVSSMMGDSWGDDEHRVQHVFVGGKKGPIRLEHGDYGVRVLTESVTMSERRNVDSRGQEWIRRDLSSSESRIMRVDEALRAYMASHEMINLSETKFVSTHAFDLNAHRAAVAGSAFLTVMTAGFNKRASYLLKVAETVDKFAVRGISKGVSEAEKIQADFSEFADNTRTGMAFIALNINVVFVEDVTSGGFEMHMWAAPDSIERLEALNSVAGTDFGPNDLSKNLPAIIQVYIDLDRTQRHILYPLLGLQ